MDNSFFALNLDFYVLIQVNGNVTSKPHTAFPGLPGMDLEPRAAEQGIGCQDVGGGRGGWLPAADSPPRWPPPAGQSPKTNEFLRFWRGGEIKEKVAFQQIH